MNMKKSLNLPFMLAVCSIATVNCTHNETSQSPMPLSARDCSTVIYNLVECTSFLVDDRLKATPDKSCCYGLKMVLEIGTECICDALKSSADLGLNLDMKKAMSLPSACGISVSPPSICNARAGLGTSFSFISDASLASIFGDSRAYTISTSVPLLFSMLFASFFYNLT
ncbi:hypothetical protein LguiA_004185 [Lonicera macranthoides]